MKNLSILFLFSCFTFLSLSAQDSSPKVLHLAEEMNSPKADLSVISWLIGHWQGEAIGGTVEEIWSPSLGGSMMGPFKLVVEGEVVFYELQTIVEENSTLILRLKHFGKDLKGWEEKDQTVDFKLIKVTPNKVYFDGITYERINKNQVNIYLLGKDEPLEKQLEFNYKRVKGKGKI